MDKVEFIKSLEGLVFDDDLNDSISTFIIYTIRCNSLNNIIRSVKKIVTDNDEQTSRQVADEIVMFLEVCKLMMEIEITVSETKLRSIVEKETRND